MFRYLGQRALLFCAVTLLSGFILSPASAMPPESPVGTWSTANGQGVIAIERCGDALCGRIVGIDREPSEPVPTDVHGQSQCGLTIIRSEQPAGETTWVGEITDPRDGAAYHTKLWVGEDGNLRLRAYIGIPLLGSTQVWRPFTGRLQADCRMT